MMNVDLTPTWVVTAMIVKRGDSTMAKIKEKVILELTNDEKTWLSFANMALAEIVDAIENHGYDVIFNSETGEIMEISDLNRAFNTIDYLLDGNMELCDEDPSPPYGYDFENER